LANLVMAIVAVGRTAPFSAGSAPWPVLREL